MRNLLSLRQFFTDERFIAMGKHDGEQPTPAQKAHNNLKKNISHARKMADNRKANRTR